MCCFVLVLGFLGPRLAFLFVWLFNSARITVAFGGSFWWPLLGLLFLPWTALAWVAAYAAVGGVTGIGWVVVAFGFLLDIASYSGRLAQSRYETRAA
ncbi:MAG: hypothetical protein WCP95_01395 [Actinomycetes bacterium]